MPAKQKNNHFWKNIFSSIISVYLGVTGVVNVILLFPGLDALREIVYTAELDMYESVFITSIKFMPAFVFAFSN